MAPSFEIFDNTAWDHEVELYNQWKDKLFEQDICRQFGSFLIKHHQRRDAIELAGPRKGAFNVHYRMRFANDSGIMIRFPMPAYFQCLEEKLLGEAAVIRLVADRTTIPVPLIQHRGEQHECPAQLGPFIVMEWFDSPRDMCDSLNNPGRTVGDRPILDPNIDAKKLRHLYGEMADVLLQLSRCDFDKIGSFAFQDGDEYDPVLTGRPLSLNVVQLGNFARVPHFELPPPIKTYTTSQEYYSALADMHLQQLSYQRNDAIESADDCRKKYIARQLFRKAAREGKLALAESSEGPFKLWCDDFRPANVLMDNEDHIQAVIDWEFAHTAPADFIFSPPWWLLLKAPEDWEAGLDDWAATYEARLETFLEALQEKEAATGAQGLVDECDSGVALSVRMRHSWESGHFWVTYAARRTWAFDGIYWKFLDEKFWGPSVGDNFMARLELLPRAQVEAMEPFVARKLGEKDEGGLVDWYVSGAESRLPPDILAVS